MEIRAYEKSDAAEIVHLFHETVHSVNRSDYSREQVEAWTPEIPNAAAWHQRMAVRITLVAEREGGMVGFAELEENGHLDMLYVRSDCVGWGVGQSLYLSIEREACFRGLRRLFTEASITARPFFEKQGFRAVRGQKVRRRGVGLTNFVMEKPIVP